MADDMLTHRLEAVSRGYSQHHYRAAGPWTDVGIARHLHGIWVEGAAGRHTISQSYFGRYDADTATVTGQGGKPVPVTHVRRAAGG